MASGPMEILVARNSLEDVYVAQIKELTSKNERLHHEHNGLKSDNLRLSHRISYLEDIRDDCQPPGGAAVNSSASRKPHPHDASASSENPVRQKPPRNFKLKSTCASVTNNNQHGRHEPESVRDAESAAVADDKQTTTLSTDSRRMSTEPNPASVSSLLRIKTSSIVDRHFGHVIRVTHHHHPHHPHHPADSASDLQSVASLDSCYPVSQSTGAVDSDAVSTVSLMARHFNRRSPPLPTRVIRTSGSHFFPFNPERTDRPKKEGSNSIV